MHVRWTFETLAMALVLLTVGTRSATAQHPRTPTVRSEADEVALALEAAPEPLRAGAGVWIMTTHGYREWRSTSNGYTCIVHRDEVDAIKPTCYDPEGTATILPAVVFFGNQLVSGMPVAEIRAQVAERFKDGRFRAPGRAGIAFMLSPRIVNVIDAAKGVTGTAPPHYMIYAPNVTNADLHLPMSAYDDVPWLPYVAYTGPHGFIIVTVPDPPK